MTTDIGQTRYSRQILFAPIGEEGQAKLLRSRVAIVGMGALGTALANHMVRSGIGYVRLIDRDFVEASNLQRQMLYDEQDAKEHMPKAIAASRKLKAVNGAVEIEPHIADLNWQNAEQLLTGVDLILDGSDNFQVRYLINDVSIKHGIPWIYGGAVSSRGMTYTIIPGETPCLRCLFPDAPAPGSAETCDTAGVIGPIIHVVAAYQAAEALKWLVGAKDRLDPRLRHFELWHNHHHAMDVGEKIAADCPACQKKIFSYLDPQEKRGTEVSMCGRETVQITLPSSSFSLDLIAERLKQAGTVTRNPFMLRADLGEYRFAVFPDGRILVQGTTEIPLAKSLVAKYIGL
ncbi:MULTISPECIES: ThiF family adenylyltransferase [Thermoactinomyces]|jgi:molybdopterin-synthase adenylyltransferase|uniref:ThiF family adenylyltransferase n=1 Tax=Thermoactinomyces daqus TaxID=1329516 RepID=A0A7W1XD56_9BACL|nr:MULTISPECIES: ThiF family adenylyltransferase [Thermoactinomyces]MBA4544428.1 ThiF family adenylyltransferase [Thermoactinomyces daqus]MBH8599534.1 ThiF family adenylyltransferase [Thermoactinomyces sp. CICC 10523]MBH8605453.1 ThiF family adenylyltransferase [Thermoactinomyces sp. CICC 10522]MBH8609189.1 ThiF family adenylyltransferase [Thermoactinomyces sp. CICC 10521]